MKKIFMAAAVVTALVFSSCNAGGGDPKTVLTAFFDAMSKKDLVAAKKLATKDSEAMFSMMEMAFKMGKDQKDNEMNFEKDKMVIGEPKIDGDKATVEVKDKEKGEAVNFLLKKESGAWKVAFDKSWFTSLAAEKMKEAGGMENILDSAGKAMDNLKDINVDSIGNKMQEGLDKIKEMQEKNPEAAKKLEEALKGVQESAEKLKQ